MRKLKVTNQRFVIVTGQSGAGKSQVIRFFEDIGYFCVDNLPLQLLTKFARMYKQPGGQIKRVALVIDIREGLIFDRMPRILEEVKKLGIEPEILFLEAHDDVLLRRFSETRRSHPWRSKETNISDNIIEEKNKLRDIKGLANLIINTSDLSIKALKNRIFQHFAPEKNKNMLSVTVTAFGFKYGLPLDADLVMDLRFLPNPFYIRELRSLSGRDKHVKEYVLARNEAREFLEKFFALLDFLLPKYIEERKTYLNIAVGCTGGKHRSVVISDEIAAHLSAGGLEVQTLYRDMGKE